MSRGAKAALTAGCVLVAVAQALAFGELTGRSVIVMAATWAVLASVIAGYVLDQGWALRSLAFLVALACSAYLYSMIAGARGLMSDAGFDRSLIGAIPAFLVFGVPAIRYLFTGRLFSAARELMAVLPPMEIAADDPLMIEATRRARETLDRFRDYYEQYPSDCCVKFALKGETGPDEYVWGQVREVGEESVTLSLVDEPVVQPRPEHDTLKVPLDEIADWQVELPDGTLRGGFTNRVLFERAREALGSLPPEMEEEMSRYADG